MQFYQPESFLFLWAIPVVIVIFMLTRRMMRQRLERLGNAGTIYGKLMPSYRSAELPLRATCLVLVILCATLALARPQWGDEKKKIRRKGVDMIFLLDTSLSMLAEDAKPSRLEKSKLEIKSIVRQLKGDRVGMIAFAGSSFLQSPLTLDYAAFFLFLDAVNVGYIPDPGTSLNRAIRLATESFPEGNLKHRAVILFTDGEDHEGGIEEGIRIAKEAGVRVYALGVGSAAGEPIPLKDERGRRTGFKKDRSGEVVMTKLNAEVLEKIAKETGGLFLPSTPAEQEVELVLRHMESLGTQEFKERLITEKEDHFQFFLAWALFFLILETLIRRTRKKSELGTLPQAVVVLFAFFLFSGFLKTAKGLNDDGNELYQNKNYQSALESYRQAQIKNPDDPSIHYNLAAALYQNQDYQQAAEHLQYTIDHASSDDLKADAYYNHGNVQYRLGDFEGAIESYEQALELDPEDQDAKYNLEFLQAAQNRFNKKDQERKKESQQQQKPEHQEQQDNQQQQQQQQNQQQQDQQNQQQQQQDQQENQEDQQDQQEQQDENPQDQEDQQQQQQEKDPDKEGEEEDQQKQQDQEEQEQQDQQDQQDQEQQDEQEKEQEQEPQQPEDQQQQQQPDQPDQQEQPQPASQQQEQETQAAPKPLQGQMSMDNALRILDALKESEAEFQDIRRPPVKKGNPRVLKDW